jgi:hypothetical protein
MMSVVALVLGCLVLLPNVSLGGSWASPHPIADVSEPTAVPPAQLVPPPAHHFTALAQTLVLTLLGACLAVSGPTQALAPARAPQPPRIPGRRGRAVLQAFLN